MEKLIYLTLIKTEQNNCQLIFMKKYFLLLCAFFSAVVCAQSFYEEQYMYPKDQFPYSGGEVQFYKDFHEILMTKDLKPCENKDEMYNLKVIIATDSSIKYLKDDSNKDMADKNKCTYDLGLEVVSYMNKWKPAVVDGEKRQSIAHFYIIPNDLFENYKEGYVPQGNAANFGSLAGGVNAFRQEVVKRVDLRGYQWNKPFKMLVTFVVNKEGEMEDFQIVQSSGLPEFDQRVINGIKSIKGKKHKWNPATINGQPVKYRFKLPLSFSASQ